jgi:hypothetical protein
MISELALSHSTAMRGLAEMGAKMRIILRRPIMQPIPITPAKIVGSEADGGNSAAASAAITQPVQG